MQNTLRIVTSGERIRGLLNLRIKEVDRNVERVTTMRAEVVVERDRLAEEARRNFEQAQHRQVHPGNHHFGGVPDTSVGLGNVFNAKREIEKLDNAIAVMNAQRAQIVWLAESFTGNDQYTLDTGDLAVLGLGSFFSGFTGAGMARGPLDLDY